MNRQSPPATKIDPAILLEAADWLVLLQSGEASEQDRGRLEHWRGRSQAHAIAWQRTQDILGTLGNVPAKVGHATLLRQPSRRQMLRMGLVAMALPAGWLAWRSTPWQEWSADLATATGEQKTLTLADGTLLVLNTRSAINVAFSAVERRLTLVAGEILITTSPDPAPAPRPFIVQTGNGSLRALGTRFSVRDTGTDTRLAVFEGAVEVRPGIAGRPGIVHAGEQTSFSATDMQPVQAVDTSAALWARGLLLARDMRLGDLVAELARYHRGVLRCDPSVAGLAISGAFPVTDTLASLDMLEKSLPVRISSATSYWITIQPS